MHPHSVPLADVSYAVQGVKGSLHSGTGRGIDKEWHRTLGEEEKARSNANIPYTRQTLQKCVT